MIGLYRMLGVGFASLNLALVATFAPSGPYVVPQAIAMLLPLIVMYLEVRTEPTDQREEIPVTDGGSR